MHRPTKIDEGPNITVFRLPAVHFQTGTGQGRAIVPIFNSFSSLKKFNPDVIHFHLIFGAGFEAVIESKLLKKPLIETNHTPILEFALYSPIQTDWFKRFLVHYDAWFYNRSDFVSSPTRLIFENMKYINPDIPHRVVSNPINVDEFHPVDGKEKTAHPFTILYAGKLAIEKKIDVVMRAVAKARKEIPDIRYLIVGKGAYESQLRDLAKSLDMEHNVVFAGFVPDKDLPRYYAQSDVFALMSTAETQSIVCMQAFATGIPVIAADAWGLKEYIVPSAGFLIKPGDEDAVTEKISYLYRNPDVRAAMGKKGREHVLQFSTANVATAWENIYHEAIERYNKKK
jgi:glycosyltransferase involved in cell wall biosynthesis